MKTIVRIRHVPAANIDFQKPSLSIKLPKTCNCWEAALKGVMKLPNYLHKGLMDEIIHIGALDFIKHDKDDHQYKEEKLNNDASLLSYDKEKE